MKYVDLHTHSTSSDGTFTPSELAAYAARKGLAAFALTDHDTTDGLAEAEAAAAEHGIEFVPGIEFSTDYNGHDIHIVGLDIDRTQKDLTERLQAFRQNRDVHALTASRIFGIRLDEFKASISGLAKSLRKPDLDNSLGVIQWCAYEGLTIEKGNVLARFGTDKAHVQGLIDYAREFLRQVKEHKDAQAA